VSTHRSRKHIAMKRLFLYLLCVLLWCAGCTPGGSASAEGGCTADKDCKGDRVCVDKQCVEKPAKPEAKPDAKPDVKPEDTPPASSSQPAAVSGASSKKEKEDSCVKVPEVYCGLCGQDSPACSGWKKAVSEEPYKSTFSADSCAEIVSSVKEIPEASLTPQLKTSLCVDPTASNAATGSSVSSLIEGRLTPEALGGPGDKVVTSGEPLGPSCKKLQDDVKKLCATPNEATREMCADPSIQKLETTATTFSDMNEETCTEVDKTIVQLSDMLESGGLSGAGKPATPEPPTDGGGAGLKPTPKPTTPTGDTGKPTPKPDATSGASKRH
jgi:hypothetical protein